MHLVGAGSLADRRKVGECQVQLPGKVVTVARHLGSHLGEKASFVYPRRRQAMMTAFYSVGQLWYESRVSWRLKRCLFTSRVVNTALSGIEAFCPSKSTIPSAHVVHGLLSKKSHGGFGSTQESSRTGPHHVQQGGFAFLETGRRGGSCVTTQVGADAGAESCTSCAADHYVVWEVACGTASYARGKRGNFSGFQSLGGTVGGGSART